MLNYLKTGLTKPKNSYVGLNMNRKQSLGYYLILILIMFIPLFQSVFPLFTQLNDDSAEIASNIPNFTVEGNSLESDSESYIHVTDTFTFFFDPHDSITEDLISEENIDMDSGPVGIALMKDNLSININGSSQSIPYEQLGSFDQAFIQDIFYQISDSSFIAILIFSVILFLSLILIYLFEFLPIAIFAYAFSMFSKLQLTFGKTVKIVLLASTLPVVIFSILNLFGIITAFDFELRMIFTLILFYLSISELKNNITNDS